MQEQNQAYDLERFSTEEFNTLRVVENKAAIQKKQMDML